MFIDLLSIIPKTEIDENIFAEQVMESSEDENGMSMHLVNILPDVCYHPHTHPYDHYLVVLEGNGFAILNGRSHRLVAGSLIFIPKDILHEVGSKKLGMKILVISHDSLDLEDPKRMVFTE